MSGTGEQGRWSPFPVQDWSRMPGETERVDPSWVDPSWGAPRSPHAAWRSTLVVLLVLALVGGGMYVADAGSRSAAPRGAAAYLPVDGAVAYRTRTTGVDGRTTTAPVVTESALQYGTAAVLALDFAFGSQVLGTLGVPPSGQRFWRTTTTEIGSVTSSQQDVALYQVGAAVALLAESGPAGGRTYAPALVVLAPDVGPGSAWTGSGRAGLVSYASRFSAEAAGDGCVRVTGTLTFTAAGQTAGEQTEVRLWCRGEGVRSRSVTLGVATTTEEPASPPPSPELRTVVEPYTWSDPSRWQQHAYEAMSIDPTFGDGPMSGVPGSAAPVVAASGLVIRPTASDDLVAFTPKTQTQWTSVWRMHPGGRVMSVAAFGDVVVVTTSRREVVAYSDAGVRLWSRPLTEIAFQSPVRTSDTEVALVDAAGDLQVLDLRTGAQRWHVSGGTEVIARPVAGAGSVVIIDGRGRVTAYGSTTGERRWTADVDAARGVIVGDVLVLHNAATLMALDLGTGRYRWLQPTSGTLRALEALGDDIVLAGTLGTTIYDRAGTVLARRPAYEAVTVGPRVLVGWGLTQAEVLRSDLTVAATWDTPDQTNSSSAIRALASRQGVTRFTSPGWTMTTWTDQP